MRAASSYRAARRNAARSCAGALALWRASGRHAMAANAAAKLDERRAQCAQARLDLAEHRAERALARGDRAFVTDRAALRAYWRMQRRSRVVWRVLASLR